MWDQVAQLGKGNWGYAFAQKFNWRNHLFHKQLRYQVIISKNLTDNHFMWNVSNFVKRLQNGWKDVELCLEGYPMGEKLKNWNCTMVEKLTKIKVTYSSIM